MSEPESLIGNRLVELMREVQKKDELIAKLRAAIKGCLPTMEESISRMGEAYAIHAFGSSRSRLGDILDETKDQIAEIRALLGEDARKEE